MNVKSAKEALKSFCRENDIALITELPEELITYSRGLALRVDSKSEGISDYCFIDPRCSDWEKILTLAHEIGHFILGHMNPNRDTPIPQEQQEKEASAFSATLTALVFFEYLKTHIDPAHVEPKNN